MAAYKVDVIEKASSPSSRGYQYAVGITSNVHDFPKYHRSEAKCKKKKKVYFIAKAWWS
jgi:hypothetical protein